MGGPGVAELAAHLVGRGWTGCNIQAPAVEDAACLEAPGSDLRAVMWGADNRLDGRPFVVVAAGELQVNVSHRPDPS